MPISHFKPRVVRPGPDTTSRDIQPRTFSNFPPFFPTPLLGAADSQPKAPNTPLRLPQHSQSRSILVHPNVGPAHPPLPAKRRPSMQYPMIVHA